MVLMICTSYVLHHCHSFSVSTDSPMAFIITLLIKNLEQWPWVNVFNDAEVSANVDFFLDIIFPFLFSQKVQRNHWLS